MSTTMERSTTRITYHVSRITVKITADQPGDHTSLWTAFASSEGVAIPVFVGRSWKSEANACKAARKWLVPR